VVAVVSRRLKATVLWVVVCSISARKANPIGALRLLFGTSPLRRATALTFFWVWLANLSLNSQFVNYTNHVFGWGPKESGPLLCVVGLMLAIAPKVLVPRIGLEVVVRRRQQHTRLNPLQSSTS
jgi:hypothetical protein